MLAHKSNEDLSGYLRGAHVDGAAICAQYVFQIPGQKKGVWGWNDTSAFYCASCGRLADEHVVLKEPPPLEVPRPKIKAAAARVDLNISQEAIEQTRADREQLATAYRTDFEMLDESIDPLSIAAQAPHQKPPQPPPPLPLEQAVPSLTHPSSAAGAVAGALHSEQVAANVSAQLAREAAYNDAFKVEVERMVRESLAQERQQEQLEKPLGNAVPIAKFLDDIGLPQYVAQFEDEAMDTETLAEVMQHQGRQALEEVLDELGVKSKGHRMKIANAVA